MKRTRRFISILLVTCLIAGLMPTIAFAEDTGSDKAIQLVNSGTAGNISGGQEDNIYFGTYRQSSDDNGGFNNDPIKWRVLSNTDGKLFLLSDQNLDAQQYNKEIVDEMTWEDSTIRSWLNNDFMSEAFSDGEKGVIAETTVDNTYIDAENVNSENNTIDKIFLLSIDEATNGAYGFTFDYSNIDSRVATDTAYAARNNGAASQAGESHSWWLRSTRSGNSIAAIVNKGGAIVDDGYDVVNPSFVVRPAFNLNRGSVLFTSAAKDGKNGKVGELTSVKEYTGDDWKLTLLDEEHSDFKITATAIDDNTLIVGYSDAKEGTNEFISAVIKDGNGAITYYGRMKSVSDTSDESGFVRFTLPEGFCAGNCC